MTLADFLRRRDCNTLLAKAMGVSEENVVPTVMKHLCQSLAVRPLPSCAYLENALSHP